MIIIGWDISQRTSWPGTNKNLPERIQSDEGRN
jgi:hypothetical protein